MAATLKLGTDKNWATKEGKLLGYNDENGNFKPIPFDVTSDADATRVNKEGLIERTKTNVPRINFDGADNPYLLLEPTRRNIVDYSEEFDQWTAVASATVTTNQGTSPDGSNTSDKLTSGATNSRVNKTFSYTNNSTMVFSVFVKNIDATNIKIGISDNITGVCNATFTFSTESISAANGGSWTNTSASFVDFGNGWYRLILISTKGAGSNLAPRIEFTESGKNVLVWGAQLEDDGSFGSVDYPTSYIPTSGSAVTRTEDNVYNGGTDSVFNLTEGTLFFDVEVFRPIDDAQRLISLSDGGSFNRILAIPKDTENQMRYFCEIGGSQDDVTLAFSYNTRQKIAIAYGGGNIKIYRNGSQQSSRTSGTTFTDLDRINFSDYDNNPKSTAKIYQTMYFNEKLSDSELATITTL